MKKTIALTVGIAMLCALLLLGGTWVYARSQAGTEAAPLSIGSAAPSDDASAASGSSGASVDGVQDGVYAVDIESQAGYRVDEVLSGQDVTVVGRTSDVRGEVTVEGGVLTAASIEVDMTTIETDDSGRDRQFLRILDTGEHPTATFVLTAPVDLSGLATGSATVQASGTLTIKGVSHEVTATLEARTTGGGAQVSGSIPVTFSDYGVAAPNLGFVQVEDAGTVEMLLELTPSDG
ncbi:YceI family protein [Oerskovia jenensis]|uniref:Polyisoprenoid-binding protein YceI n=1 Tax=Oerskovia jenensis TaxID=162169 RepID=A0ABS2LCV2_9CELL|nr:YceI family protein [Oerskovia jenensis]MBM7478245.1 polyisoprenoid-binding protein YceI [Oerskovia jenensis]